jgi:hypothetical protein
MGCNKETNETNWLTSRSTIILEMVIVLQQVKKFPAFYGIRCFITFMIVSRKSYSENEYVKLGTTYNFEIVIYWTYLGTILTNKMK